MLSYFCRTGLSKGKKLQDLTNVLADMQKATKQHTTVFARDLEEELETVQRRYGSRSSSAFKTRVKGKLRLPGPFSTTSCSLPNRSYILSLDSSDSVADPEGNFPSSLAQSSGAVLIAVTKDIKHEEVFTEYLSISEDRQPLMRWADFDDTDSVTCIVFLAVFVSHSQTAMVHYLQLLAEPPVRNIAASLDITLEAAPAAWPTSAKPLPSTLSLRLNICQPQGKAFAKVSITSAVMSGS